MIRIGEITYANSVPIFAALRKMGLADPYEFIPGEPSVLNHMLYAGEIDLAPCSSFEYGLHPTEYFLIPDLSISSDHEVKSVLLISRFPIEDLDGRMIFLSRASASSNALIRILLEKHYKVGCTYRFPEDGLHLPGFEADARIMIGNRALKAYLGKNRGQPGYVYDLSLLWREFTGLPFVFALWIIRREAVLRETEMISSLIQALYRARDFARSHIREIAGEFEKALEIPAEDLVRYWDSISFDLDEEKVKSLKSYFDYAEELGLIPKSPLLIFFPGS